MPPTPRASVVIVARNEEENIGRAIRSLLDQDVDDIEIVVVDDNSDDDTLGAASSFPGVRAVRNPHGGMSAGLNHGLSLAQSDLIIRVDADDWHLPGSIELLLGPMERDPDITVVGGSSTVVDTAGRLLDHHMAMPTTAHMLLVAMVNCPIEHTACAFRREAVENVGGYQPTAGVEIVEDYNLWLRLFDADAEFVGIRERVAVHVISSDTLTTRHKQAGLDAAAMLRSEFRRRHAPSLCTFSRLRSLSRAVISWREEPLRSDQFAYALARLGSLSLSDREYRRAAVTLAALVSCGPIVAFRGVARVAMARRRRRRAHGWS